MNSFTVLWLAVSAMAGGSAPPSIEKAGLSKSYEPWAVWARVDVSTENLRVEIFDDLGEFLSSKKPRFNPEKGVITFRLPESREDYGFRVVDMDTGSASDQYRFKKVPASKQFQKVYLSPEGNDNNDGSSKARAIRTFDRAQELVGEKLHRPHDIQVLIKPTLYENVFIRWDTKYTHPDKNIFLMPWSDQFGEEDYPHFKRLGPTHFVNAFFELKNKTDETLRTNIILFHLRIEGYSQAVNFYGKRPPKKTSQPTMYAGAPVTHNQLVDCHIKDIGSLVQYLEQSNGPFKGPYDGDTNTRDDNYKATMKALGLTNAHYSQILFNRFDANEDWHNPHTEKGEAGLMHSIYVAHYSHHNVIEYNHFYRSSGAPVKLRDNCSFNRINHNVFHYSGHWPGNISDFHHINANECPSWENEARFNTIHLTYFNPLNPTPWEKRERPIVRVASDVRLPGCADPGLGKWNAPKADNPRELDETELLKKVQGPEWNAALEKWVEEHLVAP